MAQKTFSGIVLDMFERNPGEFTAMFLMITGVIALALVAICYLFRRQTLRHAERSAMIQAGIHPDYPPNEIPDSDWKETEAQEVY
jgi:hypothetical protein